MPITFEIADDLMETAMSNTDTEAEAVCLLLFAAELALRPVMGSAQAIQLMHETIHEFGKAWLAEDGEPQPPAH